MAVSTQSDLAETSRLEAFSDGVFAIAITLLVLELHSPELEEGQRLWPALLDEWPQFAAYLTSFAILGIMWVNHHSMFRQIQRADRGLMFLNLLLLLWATLLPFPTSLFAEHLEDDSINANVAAAVYSTNLTLAAIAFSLIWWHVLRNHLVDHDMDEGPGPEVAAQVLDRHGDLRGLHRAVVHLRAGRHSWSSSCSRCTTASSRSGLAR